MTGLLFKAVGREALSFTEMGSTGREPTVRMEIIIKYQTAACKEQARRQSIPSHLYSSVS